VHIAKRCSTLEQKTLELNHKKNIPNWEI
jgi:hypothetical protein